MLVPFLIRLANQADLPELSSVCSRTFIETYEGKGANRPKDMVHEYVLEKFNVQSLQLELQDDKTETWIAAQDGAIVGYFKTTQETPPHFVAEKNMLHLERIYVLKSHHGRGVGKALISQAEERAQKLNRFGLCLGVWDENTAAIEFYLRNGFKKVGSHAWEFQYGGFHYKDIDDVFIKSVPINPNS